MHNEVTVYKGVRLCGINDINELCPEDRKYVDDFIEKYKTRSNERCCGNCATYNKIKMPGEIVEKCSDIIPSDNPGCDDYEPLPEPPEEGNNG